MTIEDPDNSEQEDEETGAIGMPPQVVKSPEGTHPHASPDAVKGYKEQTSRREYKDMSGRGLTTTRPQDAKDVERVKEELAKRTS